MCYEVRQAGSGMHEAGYSKTATACLQLARNKSHPELDMPIAIFSEPQRNLSAAAKNSLPAVVQSLFRAGFVGCGMTQFESSPSPPLLLEI